MKGNKNSKTKNLTTAEKNYKDYIEFSPTPIFVVNMDGKYTFVNNAACELFGYNHDEFLTLSIYDIASEIHDNFSELWDEVKEAGNINGVELVFKTKSGDAVYILLDSVKISENEILGFATDITKRKFEEEKYRSIISTSLDGFCIIDNNGKFIEVNKTYEEIIGYSSRELTSGMGLEDVEANENSEEIKNHISKVIKNGSDRFIAKQKCKSGKIISLELITSYIPFTKQFVVFSKNITEQQKNQYNLIHNEKLLLQAQHTANMGHYHLDFKNGIWDSSAALDNIFEIDSNYNKSIEGWLKLIHPDHIEEMQIHLNEHVIKNKQPFDKQYRILGQKSGKVKWVHGKGELVFTNDGNPLTMFGVIQDITEQKEIQEKLIKSEKNLKAFFDTSEDFHFILNETGEIIEVNETVINRLGYSFEELKNQPVLIVHPEELRSKAEKIIVEMLKGKADSCPVPLITKSGKFIPVETRVRQGIWDDKPAIFGVSKDKTELKYSQEKFEAAFQSNPAIAGLSEIDTGKYIEVNKTFYEKLGFSEGEVIGKVANKLVKMDKSFRDKAIAQLEKNGKIRGLETIIYTKDNNPLHALVNAEVIEVQGKKINFTTFLDISDQKQAQHEIEESLLRFSLAAESAGIGVWDWDIKKNILKWDDKMHELYEVDKENFDGAYLTWYDTLLDEERERLQKEIDLALEGKKEYDTEFWINLKNGKQKCLRAFAKTVRNEKGKAIRMIGVNYEITNLKNAQHELIASEQRFKTIFNDSLAVMFIIDPETMQIVDVNKTAENFYGFTKDEFTKLKISDLNINPVKIIQRDMQATLNDSGGRFEFKHKLANGEIRDVEVFSRPIKIDGKPHLNSIIHDITKRKKVENALTESEERYRKFFEHDLTGDYLSTIDGKFLDCNKSLVDMLGYSSKEELLKVHLNEIYPVKEDRNKFLELMNERKEVNNHLIKLKKKDGTIITCLENCIALLNEDGKIINLQGYLFDITEELIAEEKLKQSEQEKTNILNSPLSGLFIYNLEKQLYDYINPAYTIILGWTIDELNSFGAKFFDLFHPDDLDEVKRQTYKITESEVDDTLVMEYRFKSKKGDWLWLRTYDRVFKRNEQGKSISFISSFIDITDLKFIEESLRNRNHFIQTVLDNLPIGIALNQINDGKAIYMNKKFEEIYGWSKEEITEVSKFFELIYPDPEYREKMISQIMNDIASSDPSKMFWENIEIRTSENEIRKINAQNIPLFDQNTMVSTVLDVTSERKAEKILVESQRLSAIGEMSSAIAHDFNNSLQSILGNLELSLLKLNDNHPSKRYLEIIKKATNDAAERISQLQRFGNKALPKHSFTDLSINQLIEDVIQQTRPLWKDSKERDGIHFNIIRDFENVKSVLGNEGELRSVFYNSIKNSIESMPNGGNILIRTYHKNENVGILITDEGIGMDEKIQARIFQPFFSTKGLESGRGLGMSGAYSIIKEHNGSIYIKESKPGIGTSLVIELPPFEGDKKQEAIEENISENKSPAKILWVDDDKMIGEIAQEMLEVLGYEGKVVSSGKEAIEELKKESFDLLITDIGMPVMNGWELIKIVKETFSSDFKIAVLSGWGDQINNDEKIKNEIKYVISKPFKLNEFKTILESIFTD